MPHFNTSRYGIMVFFLVSGYIIPASLERRRCVRTFWTGRLLRIYPLYAAVDTAWLTPLHDLVRRAAEVGHGEHSISALTEVLRTPERVA